MTATVTVNSRAHVHRRTAELLRQGTLYRLTGTVSEWADEHRILSAESSPEPGPWRTSRVPYLREIQDTLGSPLERKVVWVAASQVAKTEVVKNYLGSRIHQDPGPIMVIMSTKEKAKSFSKIRLAPMIRDCPVLRSRVSEARSREAGNTTLQKTFPGGHVTIVGANSPSDLSSDPIRDVLADEVDRYPASAGTEGDPLSLGIQRTRNFWNRKVFLVSSPGDLLTSRIWPEWEDSDRRRYYVPCPHCDHMQFLKWSGVKWETSDVNDEKTHDPSTAVYVCEACASIIEEVDKRRMLEDGEWRATNAIGETRTLTAFGRPLPDAEVGTGRYPGFHVSALYSPWVTWAELAALWVEKQRSQEELKTFINLQLGEPWEERDGSIRPGELRTESYPAEIPDGVGVLTAAVDVQGDRLELAIRGWGDGEESWLLCHHRLHGDPEKADVWTRLEYHLARAYKHPSGRTARVSAAMIDSQYLKASVFRYVRGKEVRGVFAAQGSDSRLKEILSRAANRNREGVKPWTIDSHHFKTILFRRLRHTTSRSEPGGPGYMHFCAGVDAEYFAQFEAEIETTVRAGRKFRKVFKQVRERNESIDLEYLNLAALHSLGEAVRKQLGQYAARLSEGTLVVTAARRRGRVRSRGVE